MWNTWVVMVAVAGLAIAGVLWLGMLRPAVAQAGEGVITAKTFQAAHVVGRQPAPSAGGGIPPRGDIRYSDRHIVTVKLDSGIEAQGVISDIVAKQYRVGGRVKVQYQIRGFGPFWRKVMVLEITPLEF